MSSVRRSVLQGGVESAASFGTLRTLSLSKCRVNPEASARAQAEGKPQQLVLSAVEGLRWGAEGLI
jgi:hypothetical protein